jgi:hypothetical protein
MDKLLTSKITITNPDVADENARRIAALHKNIMEEEMKRIQNHQKRLDGDSEGFLLPKKTSPVKETPTPPPVSTSNSFSCLQATSILKDWEESVNPEKSIFDLPETPTELQDSAGSLLNLKQKENKRKERSMSPNETQTNKTVRKYPKLQPLDIPLTKPERENPPPVILNNVRNFATLQGSLQLLLHHRFEAKLRGRGIEISTKKMDDHNSLCDYLRENKIPFHTYRNKEERTIPVVIKGVDPSFSYAAIEEALKKEGFTVDNLYRLQNFETGEWQPTVFADLPVNTKNRTIYDLRTLLHMRVKVEERKRLNVTVCMKCSEYGHTKKYCNNPLRCGRCGGDHEIGECLAEKPCCPRCKEDHPATYRLCREYLKEEKRIDENRNKNFDR